MKPLALAPLALSVSLLLAAPGFAQTSEVDHFGPVRANTKYESPQDMAVELRVGPYLPNIDDEFAAATPFADHFGNDTRWHVGFELDWQLLRIPHFGTVGPGVGFGLTALEGQSFGDGGVAAEQKTTLSILPMHAVGVARVDTFALDFDIPFVPYGKVGLGYALWWTDDGGGLERAAADGRRGEDTSYGLVWALGAMLMLDVFDPVAATDLDSTMGVNHSYLYLEWFNSDLDGFDSGKLQVGVNTWMTGLTLEM